MSDVKKKILVADDETHITTLYQAVLGMEGYEIVVTDDGQSALNKARASKPDLMILDIKLPSLTGWEVCKKVKSDASLQDVPVIIASAFGQKEDRNKSAEAGADDFLPKPFDSKTLLEHVRKFI